MHKQDIENLFGYQARLYPLKEEDGGGWAAEIIELPGCFSDGESPEEALINVRDAILGWIEIAKEDGKTIPQPKNNNESLYSGKFTIRVPKTLHKKLVEKSKQENISLNQLVNSLLSYNLGYLDGGIASSKNEFAASENDEIIIEYKRFLVKKSINKNQDKGRMLKLLESNNLCKMDNYRRRA